MKRECVIAAFSGLTLGIAAFVVYRELKKEKKYIEVPKNKDEEPEEKHAEPEKHEDESKNEDPAPGYDEESELPLEEDIFMVVDEKPYRITEDEHNDTGITYDTETLTYYADGALADMSCQLINDVTDIFGSVTELTEAFADDDVDVVWMRNDVIGYDYEIVRDPRRYIDIVKANPYLMGGYYSSEDDEE